MLYTVEFLTRCLGLWYTERKHCSCYFKSTDGHVHKWEFSSKRLNMNVALAACASEGCIIVDSTRRGKRFPDSMSYTIPIWCAVLNHIVLGLGVHESLHLPPWIPTGLSEAVLLSLEAILVQLHGDVRGLLLSTLSGSLTRPLRPIWCSVEEGNCYKSLLQPIRLDVCINCRHD